MIRLISTSDDVRDFVAEANALQTESYEKMIEFLNSHKYNPSTSPPPDENSREFLEWQLALWKEISGRTDYSPSTCEADNNVTLKSGLSNPFPYCTDDPSTTGNYLGAIGLIIKALSLKRGDRVIEFGVGWAHTTISLAKCGYKVTAIDIEKKFLDILTHKAAQEGLDISTHHGEFVDFPEKHIKYDAALFFECFHHCLNFQDLLLKLRSSLTEYGRIVFCGEPFYGDWFDYPWGIRLDGHSIWAIRNFGWMELGFREDYIVGLLTSLGFNTKKLEIPEFGSNGIALVAALG